MKFYWKKPWGNWLKGHNSRNCCRWITDTRKINLLTKCKLSTLICIWRLGSVSWETDSWKQEASSVKLCHTVGSSNRRGLLHRLWDSTNQRSNHLWSVSRSALNALIQQWALVSSHQGSALAWTQRDTIVSLSLKALRLTYWLTLTKTIFSP